MIAKAKVEEKPEAQTPAGETASQEPVVLAQAPAQPPLSADAERYAQREARAAEQARYRGGDVIVISMSTIVVALLVVILILLLT